jgi:hypothetical protein
MIDRKFQKYQVIRGDIEDIIEREKFTADDIREMIKFLDEDLEEIAKEKAKNVI